MLTVDPHPLLDLRAFVTTFPRPLGEMPSPPAVAAQLAEGVAAPLQSDDAVRCAISTLRALHKGWRVGVQ